MSRDDENKMVAVDKLDKVFARYTIDAHPVSYCGDMGSLDGEWAGVTRLGYRVMHINHTGYFNTYTNCSNFKNVCL